MRKLLQRLRTAWRSPGAVFVYHRDYAHTLPGVPLDPRRAEEILAFLLYEGLIRRRDVSRPIPASLENILRVHTPAYLDALQDPATMTGIFGFPIPDDQIQRVIEHERLVVGGTIQATRLALMNGGRRIAVNLQGGMHHAAPERGMGFCVFNDIAVAIRRLQERGRLERALVIDLDIHDGNGTRAAFAEDPRVYTYSIHNADWDDGPSPSPATRIALGSGITDEQYLAVVRETLPPVLEAHRPELVIYIAGCDPAAGDRIGDWRITAQGMLARDQFVTHLVRGPDLATPRPLAILPGGGYGSGAWRFSARFFSWLLAGRVHEPPGDMEAILRRFRPIAREFAAQGLAAAAPPGSHDDFGLTAEDLGAFGGGGEGLTRETRILGHYSQHGIELLFERLGFYKKIRALGYSHPVLEVDFASGLGQTLRIYGDEAKTLLLMELRLNRSHRVVPGMEVIFVEWLLLQNPRASFTDQVRPLPGQEHPGLGLLGEVVGWMMVACETIGLDGIVHVPSHFHLAVVGRHHLRFLQPEQQAHFEALYDALRRVPLVEATRALEAGQVVDAKTGEAVRYIPGPTVMPVSERLRAKVQGLAYDEAVNREKARFQFVLRQAP